jgi:hypothetical protein
MSEAALNSTPQDTLYITDGGIASFLTATVGDWAENNEAIPQNGIAEVKNIADRLAKYGRHEDEYMVHAAEGETVIPKEVLESSPHLQQHIFAEMEAMGLDPQSYIVGSELNSINPITGQPEFFLKKLLKKVVKVVKKVLPAVLPIALSFTPLGAVYGSALGSGIGTLMRGGKLKDALKSAVISGGIGGLTAGLKGGFGAKPGQTFGQGFSEAAGDAFGNVGQRFGQTFGGAPEGTRYFQNPLSDTPRYGEPTTTGPTTTGPTADGLKAAPTTGGAPGAVRADAGYDPYADLYSGSASPGAVRAEQQALTQPAGYDPYADLYSGSASPGAVRAEQQALTAAQRTAQETIPPPGGERGFFQKTVDFLNPKARRDAVYDQAYDRYMEGLSATEANVTAAKAEAERAMQNMGIISQYGPAIGALGLGAAGAGFFDPPETDDEEEEDGFPEYDPEGYKKYMIDFPTAPNYTMADIRVPGRSVGFADGGLASLGQFPRRSGRIAGPGTERSDDVPAMLSDGEFVMTAKAVRGAGNGSRNNGMNKMYQMMRTFEGNA